MFCVLFVVNYNIPNSYKLENTRENPTTARKFCGEATHNVKSWYKYFYSLTALVQYLCATVFWFVIVNQNCFWKIADRRMQRVYSMALTRLYAD